MKRSLFGAAAIAAFALSVVLIGTASAKPPAPPAPNNTCPTNPKTLPTSNIVGAAVVISGSTSTYYFMSFTDPAQTSLGTPGLVNYCVYGTATPTAVTVDPLLKGADGSSWTASKPSKNFGFSRPGGEKTNIELNGQTVKMGTATWTGTASVPTAVVLHISSAAECARLGIASATCFVLPGPPPGPVCNAGAGNDKAGYNALPTDIGLACPPQDSYSFEGLLPTKEFGDKVQLNTTSGTTFDKMTVSFASFGCGTTGHWYDQDGACTTASGATFTIPDTTGQTGSGGLHARLYSVKPDGSVDAQLGVDAVNNDPIPFRPSADNVKCVNPGTDANGGDDRGKWYNAAANLCMNSYPFLVSFDFSGQNLQVPAGDTVVWTVWYDTTNSGQFPLGELPCRTIGNPGCGYDSLNVGSWTFANAPYAGTDLVPAEAWVDDGKGGGLIAHTDSVDGPDYTDFKPLAEITLK